MSTRLVIRILIACGCAAACNNRRVTASSSELHHYFDDRDQPLPAWDSVWNQLDAVFGSGTPPRITIRRFSGDGGRFEPPHTIVVSDALDGNGLVEVVAHESSHLSMYELTRGASATEPFRFFDEGYSDVVGKMIAGKDMASHKRSSLAIASREVNANGVGFATLQHWSAYAGNVPSQKQAYAYPVGSSFVYFVIDLFGQKKLFDLFRDIGETRDLDTSLRNTLGLTAAEVERRWKAYLPTSPVAEPPLAITEMSPSNASSDVPVDVAELRVKFSVPMTNEVCVSTPCGDSGVCYRNAAWKDDRTLVIRTDGKLRPGTTYELELGSSTQACELTSAGGARLPATRWVFTTNKQTRCASGQGQWSGDRHADRCVDRARKL